MSQNASSECVVLNNQNLSLHPNLQLPIEPDHNVSMCSEHNPLPRLHPQPPLCVDEAKTSYI